MKYLGLVFASWVLWLPVTFWFGRVFCRWLCPLGLSQGLVNWLFHPRSHVRRVCENLPRGKWQLLVSWLLVAAYFLLPVGCWLSPWGIFGRVLVLFAPGVVLFAAILVLAAFGHGRVWCNWICPMGTIFDLVAKLGWREAKACRSCGRCRRCFR